MIDSLQAYRQNLLIGNFQYLPKVSGISNELSNLVKDTTNLYDTDKIKIAQEGNNIEYIQINLNQNTNQNICFECRTPKGYPIYSYFIVSTYNISCMCNCIEWVKYSDSKINVRLTYEVLFPTNNVAKDIDETGIDSFELFGNVIEPFTWFRNIRSIPSGSWVEINKDLIAH